MNGEISEADAKTLIDEHLRERGWNLKDFSILRKEYTTPYGNSTDYVFLKEGVPFAILEAKKPGKDLYGALQQAKNYAKEFIEHNIDIFLIFASDGKTFLKQNLKARTLPERIEKFPTPQELKEIIIPECEKVRINLKNMALRNLRKSKG